MFVFSGCRPTENCLQMNVFYESNWQSDLKSHISSPQLTTPSCCGSDRGNWVQTEKMKGQTTEASLGCYYDFLPQVPRSPLSPSPTLKLSEAMCSLHYKGFCSRMRHPSQPSDVFFLHLPLTLSQFSKDEPETRQHSASAPECAEMLNIHTGTNQKAIWM